MGFALPRNLWPQREPDFNPPDVTPAWLVRAFKTAANMFMVVCIVVVWMRCLDVARENSVPLIITHAGWWVGNVQVWFPLFAPLVVAAIALPWTAKIIIPAFCTFSWRAPRQFWPKLWCAILTVLLALVIMTAAFPLYHKAYNVRFKDEATRLEQVDMGRAALQANLDSINADLKDITNPALTTYQSQAAREGADAWAKRVATAKAQNDYQADAIERALAAAERGDQLRADRAKAIQALAAAPTKAAAMDQVSSGKDFSAQGMVDFLEEWWPFALFAVVELMALIAGWVAYMMEMVRTRQLADWEAVHSAPVSEAGIDALAIEDFSNQPQVRPQKYSTNEKGEKMVWVHMGYYKDGTEKGHWRVLPSEKKRTQEEMDAAAAAKDAGKRNPSDWYVKNETSMFDGVPEDGQNPQSEVSDEQLVLGEEIQRSAEAQVSPRSEDAGEGDSTSSDVDDDTSAVYGSSESLTHAQEDQQAEYPEQETQADVGELPREDVGSSASDSFEPDALEQHEGEQAEAVNEPITWEDTPDLSELTEEEIAELEREWRARRGLPAPTEAAE